MVLGCAPANDGSGGGKTTTADGADEADGADTTEAGTTEGDPCSIDLPAYEAMLAAQLSAEATACTSDDECTRLSGHNDCKSSCTGPALNKSQSAAIGSYIANYVAENCSECLSPALQCPAIYMEPQCKNGVCE
jgi:hypothetical protein